VESKYLCHQRITDNREKTMENGRFRVLAGMLALWVALGVGTTAFAQEKIIRGLDLRDLDLSGIDLSGALLENVNLSGANLTGANLEELQMNGGTLHNANLTDAILTGARLESIDLSVANLANVDLNGASLVNTDLRYVRLRGTRLAGANLTGAFFSGDIWYANAPVTMSPENLDGADLSEFMSQAMVHRPVNGVKSESGQPTNFGPVDLLRIGINAAEIPFEGARMAELLDGGINLFELLDDCQACLADVTLEGVGVIRLLMEGLTLAEFSSMGVQVRELSLDGVNVIALMQTGINISQLNLEGYELRSSE
jgi:uncharacterized protein YjbI with pentapeptide repeats